MALVEDSNLCNREKEVKVEETGERVKGRESRRF